MAIPRIPVENVRSHKFDVNSRDFMRLIGVWLGDGWLRTGDKFSQDADGYFWYAGREDDMFKSGGAWVSPVEVENILMEHSTVLEAAVVGKKNATGLVKPMAYVVLRAGSAALDANALVAELKELCAERLPRHKRPEWIEVLKELPKTATDKIQRFKLRQESEAGAAA